MKTLERGTGMKRRVLFGIITGIICACMLSVGVCAADVVASGEGSGFSWFLTDDGILTIEGSQVPASRAGGAPWYGYREQIKKIELYPNATYMSSIGDYAFYDLPNLRNIELHDGGVGSIGAHAFENCINLEKMYLWFYNGYSTIGEKAFYSCSKLKEISLSGSSKIGEYAFGKCENLKTIYVSSSRSYDSYINIEAASNAFSGIEATVFYPIGFKKRNLDNFEGTLTWIESNNGICGGNARWNYDEENKILTVWGSKELQHLASGSYQAWYAIGDDNIECIVVEDGITKIPSYSFEYLGGFSTCILPRSLVYLAANAFNDCCSLNNLLIPESVQKFGHNTCFNRCNALTDIYYMGSKEEWDMIENSNAAITDSGAIVNEITVHFLELAEKTATCTQDGIKPHYRFDDYTSGSAYPYIYNLNKEQISSDEIIIKAEGHTDEDKDSFCDNCGEKYIIPPTPGDIDGDNQLTQSDLLYLTNYWAGHPGYSITDIPLAVLDMDSDGVITRRDKMILERHLAGWSGYENLPLNSH